MASEPSLVMHKGAKKEGKTEAKGGEKKLLLLNLLFFSNRRASLGTSQTSCLKRITLQLGCESV